MSDYIKREDAINIKNYLKRFGCFGDDGFVEIEGVLIALSKIPSADVAPVRHGTWIVGERMPMYDIKGNLSWGNWYTCNQCEFKTYAIEGHITQYRYCPSCGAKMDEGGSNGTDD